MFFPEFGFNMKWLAKANLPVERTNAVTGIQV